MWKNVLYFWLIIITQVIAIGRYVGDQCINDDEVKGVCSLVTDCESAVRSIKTRGAHGFKRCGFRGDMEIVCCPRITNKSGPDHSSPTGTRKADRECQKIIASAIPPLNLYIIGGEEASVGEFPHMVALAFDRGALDGSLQFDCGGSLISEQYVLTAAHCTDTLDGIAPSIARVGVVNLGDNKKNDKTDFKIVDVKNHPNYTRREKYHDLSLLRLEKPIQYSATASPACLYTSNKDPKISLTITGWGVTSNKKNVKSNILLKANVTIVTNEECSQSYTGWRKLPNGIAQEQLCAGDSEGLRDTCQGDSGGPLQGLTADDGQYRLVGVTSFGRGCGSSIPGVYTRISDYLDWIESVVWS